VCCPIGARLPVYADQGPLPSQSGGRCRDRLNRRISRAVVTFARTDQVLPLSCRRVVSVQVPPRTRTPTTSSLSHHRSRRSTILFTPRLCVSAPYRTAGCAYGHLRTMLNHGYELLPIPRGCGQESSWRRSAQAAPRAPRRRNQFGAGMLYRLLIQPRHFRQCEAGRPDRGSGTSAACRGRRSVRCTVRRKHGSRPALGC
jgi:hypothetical protein